MSEIINKFMNASSGKGFNDGVNRKKFPELSPTKIGLTDDAQSKQGLTSMAAKRRKFETVFAGETGTVPTSSLGLPGRI